MSYAIFYSSNIFLRLLDDSDSPEIASYRFSKKSFHIFLNIFLNIFFDIFLNIFLNIFAGNLLNPLTGTTTGELDTAAFRFFLAGCWLVVGRFWLVGWQTNKQNGGQSAMRRAGYNPTHNEVLDIINRSTLPSSGHSIFLPQH